MTEERGIGDDQALLLDVRKIIERADLTADQKCLAVDMLVNDAPTQPLTAIQVERNLAWMVWQKTNGLCAYCKTTLNPFDRNARNGFHIEHVIPKSRGGADDLSNLTPACSRCNFSKANRTPEEWRTASG